MYRRITRRQFVAAASATVLMLGPPGIAFAEDDAIAFVASLYALPSLWSDVTADPGAIEQYLDANLGALITTNYERTDFEAALDYDPLIQAQDFGDIKTTFRVESQTADSAVVAAAIENFGEETMVTLDLTKTTSGWRLADIHPGEGMSLVAELMELNALPVTSE